MPDKKPTPSIEEERAAAREHMKEMARDSRENRKEEYLATIATQQAKMLILLQEISNDLSQANDTLAAILTATQKSR
jgi:hypothetical protein